MYFYDNRYYSGKENLLQLAVSAARNRASLGEISSALEVVWGRHVASTQVYLFTVFNYKVFGIHFCQ